MLTEIKTIHTQDKQKLHCSIIENGSPVWIVVTHGLGEHGARHDYFFKYFSQYFNICLYDLRGHGLSSGQRAYVNEFRDFTNDLEEVIAFLMKEYAMKRYVLFGHSMGGLITASYMQKNAQSLLYPEKVFLSAPPVAAPGPQGKFFSLAPLFLSRGLASLNASIALGGMLDIKKLSHDPRIYENYIADSLNSLKIQTKLFFNILAEAREVFSKPLRVNCNLYVAVGTKDVLIDPNALIEYFCTVEKNAKLLKVEGAYHEMHNEVEKFRDPYMKFLKESLMESIYT
jgi:acylglycerol lipase